jgi:putative ABC transport system permease protein
MSRRMGLTAGTHLRSLLIELGAVVGLGWLAGTAAGVGGYALLAGSLDVQPQLPPGAALELPALSLAVTASVVALVVVIAAVGAHVGAERAHPAEILRLA